ncbi:MAG: hypothetical protein QOK37_3452 [Thermoanaerobaculia bacterium]|nr:hypothetical protein [Thermoanaerobaculia bacterium]
MRSDAKPNEPSPTMSINTPKGPQQSGASFSDVVEIAAGLWRFLTRTTLGAVIAIAIAGYLLFSLAVFAIPRASLYMAQSKEADGDHEKKKREGDRACFAVVIDATENCLGDASLPQPGGDLAGAMTDASPGSILLPDGSVDGYFQSYYNLTVKAWQAAAAAASSDDERTRRQCITQIITERWGEKNTFAAYSGHISKRDVVKNQIGWFVKPIVRLKAPDFIANIDDQDFTPLAPGKVKETCDR